MICNGRLPDFHKAQLQIAEDDARYKVIAAGRRFGKGVLGVSAALRMASRGGKCRWIAPSYSSDSYQSGWKFAGAIVGQIPGAEVHLQKREFNFTRLGGGWLQFRTAEEPDALRGEGIDFVVFDEAAHIPGLESMWQNVVRPSLMDRRGEAWFISTPNGFNYFNTLYLRGRGGGNWKSYRFPTSANPHIYPDEIAELRNTLPGLVARQEIEAEFVQLAGALFKRQNVRIIEAEPSAISWVRSWDLAYTAKTTSDRTAGVRMGLCADGTVVVADVVSGTMEWPEAVRCIADTARLDGPAVRQGIECVSAQVGVLQTLLRDPLLSKYTFMPIEVHRDKITRALGLMARSEQGKVALVRGNWNQGFLDELCAFPEGRHDDQVDAFSGGMTLLSAATGAFDAATVKLVKIGNNVSSGRTFRHFTPRRLVTA